MKLMVKKIAVIFPITLGLLLMADTAGAQDHRPKAPKRLPDSARVEGMIEHLSQELKLSPEQKAEIAKLHHEHFNQVREMMKRRKKQQQSHKGKMDSLINVPEVGKMFEKVNNESNSTDEQKEDFLKKHQKYADQAKVLIVNEKSNHMDHLHKMKLSRKEFETKLLSILDDDQKLKFRKIREEHRQSKQHKRKSAHKH